MLVWEKTTVSGYYVTLFLQQIMVYATLLGGPTRSF